MRRLLFFTKRLLLLWCLCLFAFPAPVSADKPPITYGNILGTIRDQNGAPLPGVELFIDDWFQDTTDSAGQYFISFSGSYHVVTLYLLGYTFSPASITIGSGTTHADFTGTAHLWGKSVEPSFIFNDVAREITVSGAGFTDSTVVQLGDLSPLAVTAVTTDTLRAIVPARIAPGSYDLHLSDEVTTGTLQAVIPVSDTLEDALAVTPAGSGELGTWKSTSPLNLDRANFGLVLHNGYLYALGGTRSSGLQLSSVERALIQADGSLGPWVLLDGAFQDTNGSLGAVQLDGWIYIAGKADHAEWATIQSDASLSAWITESPINKCSGDVNHLLNDGFHLYTVCANWGDTKMTLMSGKIYQNHIAHGWGEYTHAPVPNNYVGMAQYGHALYEAGGLLAPNTASEAPLASVNKVPLQSDGNPGVWSTLNSLSEARGQPALAPAAGRLFALGGSGAYGGDLLTVESAAIHPDGSLGVWKVSSSRLTGRHVGGSALQVGKYLYVAGGGTRTVEFAPIHPNGANRRYIPVLYVP